MFGSSSPAGVGSADEEHGTRRRLTEAALWPSVVSSATPVPRVLFALRPGGDSWTQIVAD